MLRKRCKALRILRSIFEKVANPISKTASAAARYVQSVLERPPETFESTSSYSVLSAMCSSIYAARDGKNSASPMARNKVAVAHAQFVHKSPAHSPGADSTPSKAVLRPDTLAGRSCHFVRLDALRHALEFFWIGRQGVRLPVIFELQNMLQLAQKPISVRQP